MSSIVISNNNNNNMWEDKKRTKWFHALYYRLSRPIDIY